MDADCEEKDEKESLTVIGQITLLCLFYLSLGDQLTVIGLIKVGVRVVRIHNVIHRAGIYKELMI